MQAVNPNIKNTVSSGSAWIPAGTGKGEGIAPNTPLDYSQTNSYNTDASGITYDQNGYVVTPKNLWGNPNQTNPYQNGYMNAENAAASGIPQAQANISAWGQQAAQMGEGDSSSGYPAMQNSYGLGSMPGSASGSDYSSSPITVTVPDTASRGFNPWSLTGESNARGRS